MTVQGFCWKSTARGDESVIWEFLTNFPELTRQCITPIKLTVDGGFKGFVRDYGILFDYFFYPVKQFLIYTEWSLVATPWPIILALLTFIVLRVSKSSVMALATLFFLVVFGYLQLWEEMMATLSIVLVATTLCIAVGIPLGTLMARSDRTQKMILPILDIMQTIPAFVYLIPVIMLLGIGKVPALISVCIYALPPVVRLTDLGIRLVDKEVLEAADAFGSTSNQRLFQVQIPLALPNIFAGVNQTTLMALSMVVIASMIGAPGLGRPVLQAIQNQYLTQGLIAGAAIVMLAIVIDRTIQSYGQQLQKHRHSGHGV